MTETINPFVSENYKTNFDSLRKAIEAGNVIKAGKQYNKTVSVLSEALEGLTDRAEDVAKHVIRSDLGKYKEPIGKKPSGFISRLIERLKKILRIEASTESRMNDFIKTLPKNSSEVTWEINKKYTETFSKIADLERSKEKQQKNLLDEVNSVSKEEHDPKRRDSGYDTEEEYGEPGYDDISDYKKEEGNKLGVEDKHSISGFSEKQIEEILTLTPPPVPKKTPGANKIGKYIYGHQNPEQLSIILEKKLFDMAARNNLSENNIKFLQSRSAEDISELKNPEGKTALEVAEKAGNQQFMDIAYSKLEEIKGDNQEINRRFNECFIEKSEKTKSTTVKERAKIFEKLGTNPADITQKALPSTGVMVSKIVEQFERPPINPTESKGR